ncbi:hypothetical protein AMJ57_04020 [Parcubacteria bacterium SG8_24]|nr:MAG: hypothetical protein AMJ57_04020 [Parcubacteria bacterium SG8_24]
MPEDHGGAILAERWFDEIRVSGCRPEERFGIIENILSEASQALLCRSELRKTEAEQELILEGLAALDGLRGGYGFPAVEVSVGRIHILDQEEYDVSISGGGGNSTYGHIYLPRYHDPVIVATVITHELVHLSGYSVLQAVCRPSGGGGRDVAVEPLRSGLGLFSDDRQVYSGLNESVTEVIACKMRRIMAPRLGCLDEAERQRLTRTCASYPQAKILDRLCWMADWIGGRPSGRTRDEAFEDYWGGGWDFIETLRRFLPGADRALYEMGTEYADAIEAAGRLNLDDLAEEFRRRRARL